MTDDDMARRFASDTANHQMTVLHDDGLYRHVRFRAPTSGFYWFDLVTWPGKLAFTGDMEGYVFSRLDDMFDFFRGGGINPYYWSEKLVTGRGRDGAKTYSEERFRQLVTERFVEQVQAGKAPRGLGKAVREQILDDLEITYEEGARLVLSLFEYKGFQFTDTWEWDLCDWDWSFLWCCHAIRWGISQYDQRTKS